MRPGLHERDYVWFDFFHAIPGMTSHLYRLGSRTTSSRIVAWLRFCHFLDPGFLLLLLLGFFLCVCVFFVFFCLFFFFAFPSYISGVHHFG